MTFLLFPGTENSKLLREGEGGERAKIGRGSPVPYSFPGTGPGMPTGKRLQNVRIEWTATRLPPPGQLGIIFHAGRAEKCAHRRGSSQTKAASPDEEAALDRSDRDQTIGLEEEPAGKASTCGCLTQEEILEMASSKLGE